MTYDSAPGGVQLDPFPAKTVLRFEHDLGLVPLLPQAFVAFGSEGTNGAGGGSVAAAAGNLALFTCIDAHVIEVKNDSCERELFVRVMSVGIDSEADPDACSP